MVRRSPRLKKQQPSCAVEPLDLSPKNDDEDDNAQANRAKDLKGKQSEKSSQTKSDSENGFENSNLTCEDNTEDVDDTVDHDATEVDANKTASDKANKIIALGEEHNGTDFLDNVGRDQRKDEAIIDTSESRSQLVQEAHTSPGEPKAAHAFSKSKIAPNGNELKKKENDLTRLVPGYTAPMSLVPVQSTANESTVDRLNSLRRKAIMKESASYLQRQEQPHGFSSLVKSFKTGRLSKQAKLAASSATAGSGWFHMRPTPMTDDLKKDLSVIQNRNYLDPKRFYKSNDERKNKNMVQLGTVIEGSAEFYSSRLTKKQRRGNITDELLADKSITGYTQNKYLSMQREKTEAATKRRKMKGKHGRKR